VLRKYSRLDAVEKEHYAAQDSRERASYKLRYSAPIDGGWKHMSSEDELERLKAKKLAELQERLAEEEEREKRELERQAAMRAILTPEARQRLANLRLIKPELVAQLEEQLIQLANSGRIRLPITDDDLKTILSRLTSKRSIRIRRA